MTILTTSHMTPIARTDIELVLMSLCVCVCVRACVCMCVCVCVLIWVGGWVNGCSVRHMRLPGQCPPAVS